jgi:predicted MFS family arabinose efflux permease
MPRRWIVLAVLFAARAATGYQFQSVGSTTNLLMHDLALGYAQLGILLGAYLLPGIVVAFPAGLIGQRVRETTLGFGGLALMVVSGIALSYCDSFSAALIARVIGGVGATIVILVATKMTTDWFAGREIVLAMSLLQMSWPFGAMVALPAQTYLAQSLGWPAVMASSAMLALVALGAFTFLPRSPVSVEPTTAARSGLPARILVPILVAGAIWGAMNLACVLFFSYAPQVMVAQGSSPTGAASLVGLAIWFTIVAIPAGGYLVERSGRPVAAIVVCGLAAALALGLFVANIHPTIACLVFGVAIGPLSGAILSLPTRVLEPRDRSLGFGVFFTCFYVLMAIGPSAAGRLQDAWGEPSAALIAGAALLAAMAPLSLLFSLLIKRREVMTLKPATA